ncbi:MAG: DNA cytosine methyltransferase [Desulfitobacterium hafniense]|nr:DNA cytosine methyltransferase [Desulfitobacterium hafniense]
MKLTHFSLFSGIGGIDLAAEWAGFETVGQCEFADYPTKVLEKHWPHTPRWRDVRDVTLESVRNRGIRSIDLISGGDPCQPHSLANKERKGTDDERFLWPEYLRIVQELRPNWVINENVIGSISNGVLSRKINEMEQEGYNCTVFSIPAFAVGAWHFRQRVVIIANSNSNGLQRGAKPGCFSEMRENYEKQLKELCEAYTLYPYSVSESQEDQEINPIREKWNAWKDITRELGGTLPRTYWTLSEPPIPGVDNGIPNRMERSKCLGNTVVPQMFYPIFQAIADIERTDQKWQNTKSTSTTTCANFVSRPMFAVMNS